MFDTFLAGASLDRLLAGLLVTVQISVVVNLVSLPLGFLVTLARMSKLLPLRWITAAYIEVFRCTPALLQIVWFFFCLPIAFGLMWSGTTMAIIVLALNLSAFNSEAFRAAIQGIPKAQHDASRALGLDKRTEVFLVILPQALRNCLPILVTNGILTFQQSSLVALVGVGELMYQGKLIASESYLPVETFTLVALVYLAVSIPLGRLGQLLDHMNQRYR